MFGLKSFSLEKAAQAVDGRTLMSDPEWRITLTNAIANPNIRFTVNLNGMTGGTVEAKVMNAVQRAAANAPNSSLTDWEMLQLYQANKLHEVSFTSLGPKGVKVLVNPFSPR